MYESIVNLIIKWTGALGVLLILALVTVLLAYVFSLASAKMARHLTEFVRFATARYWVARMEKEGLTVMQTEYRRMVAERKPKNFKELSEVNSEEENRLREIARASTAANKDAA